MKALDRAHALYLRTQATVARLYRGRDERDGPRPVERAAARDIMSIPAGRPWSRGAGAQGADLGDHSG